MNVFNFDELWKLMSKYTFIVDNISRNDSFSCYICHNLMIDACQSVCGCQYCRKCISEYLGNEDKFCPGDKAECSEEFLVMDTNVMRNVRMNKIISNLKALCPNVSCLTKIELSKMQEHLRLCLKQPFECPYVKIGCPDKNCTKDSISAHLTNETLNHTQFLIECITNLKDEVSGLKVSFELSKVEMTSLQEEFQQTKAQYNVTLEQMTSERNELFKQLSEQRNEIDFIKREFALNENRIAKLEEQLEEMKKETELRFSSKTHEANHIKEIDCASETKDVVMPMYAATEEIKFISDNRDQRINDWIRSYPSTNADFIWRIDELSNKKRTMRYSEIFSEPYYSHNYKSCLYLRIGSDYIWLGCVIMKGDHDDKVTWPMKRFVTLSIINQDTLTAHNSVKIQYDTYEYNKCAFDRPMKDRNEESINSFDFIKYSFIKDIPSIIVNDSIVVSCILSDS